MQLGADKERQVFAAKRVAKKCRRTGKYGSIFCNLLQRKELALFAVVNCIFRVKHQIPNKFQ